MGGLAQKITKLFTRPDEDLPLQDDVKFHQSIENYSEFYGKKQVQKKNIDDEKIKRVQFISQQANQQMCCPLRMLQMMQGKQYDTQPFKTQQQQIGQIISKLN